MPHIDQVHIDNTYYDVQDIRIPASTSSDSGKVIGVDSNGNYTLTSGGGASTLSGLSDVDIDILTIAPGQVLKYDATTYKWKNETWGTQVVLRTWTT